MKDGTSNVISLISKIHAQSAAFLKQELQNKGLPEMVSSHGNILFQLSKSDRMTMKQLAENIHRDKSTVTVLVNKLVELGYVEKETSREDSRVVYATLTEKGREYTVQTSEISVLLNETCFSGFSQSEKEEVYGLLCRISDNFMGE